MKNSKINLNKINHKINLLRREIENHDYLYYVLDSPILSDAAYDSLKRDLIELEKKYPSLIVPSSPTQRVGGKPLDDFKKIKHQLPMLSLKDAFNQNEMLDWEKRIKKLLNSKDKLNEFNYFSELKLDGLAVSLIYQKGIFKQGATRGDGKIGEDITQNLKTISSIPLKLYLKKLDPEQKERVLESRIEIRGEVVILKKDFKLLNQQRKKQGQSLFSNPRNAAAGSLRQKDSKMTAKRKLSFYAYDLVSDLKQKTHQENHQLLQKLGFPITKYSQVSQDLKGVIKLYDRISKIREKLSLEVDGIVIRTNQDNIYSKLGSIGREPRGAIALKFPGIEAITKIKDIIIQVGRTGRLTPVAILEPKKIGGATIQRATLHNQDEIERLDVRIGDTVIIQRAGDVIPDVVKVLKNLRTGKKKKFKIPNKCPACGIKTIQKQGEVDSYCSNKKCFQQQLKKLIHFVSKSGLDIAHLGPRMIEQLYQSGLIKDQADIFNLKQKDLILLERFAEKSTQNIIEAIEKAKKISLSKLLFALGIRHLGRETAVLLANYFNSLEKIKKLRLEDLEKIQDIGPIVAKSVLDWFNNRQNLRLLEKLQNYGIIVICPKKTSKKLKNKTFIFSGSLEKITREQARERVRNLGGNISSSVSKQTDYLVLGSEPGSKYQKAKKIRVKILSENVFLKMTKK